MSKKLFGTVFKVVGLAALTVFTLGVGAGMAAGLTFAEVAALTVGGIGLSVGTIGAIGLVGFSLGNNFIAAHKAARAARSARAQNLNAAVQPNAPALWIFGETAFPAQIVYSETINDKKVVQLIGGGAHQIHSLGDFYINDEKVEFAGTAATGKWKGSVSRQLRTGTDAQSAIRFSGSLLPATARGRGFPYYSLEWNLEGDEIKNGIPNRLTQEGKGCLCYDPRRDSTVPGGSGTHRIDDQTTWEWSANWALIVLFYLIGWKINGKLVIGRGDAPEDIDLASFMATANVCDQIIDGKPRYHIGGIMPVDGDHERVIGELEATIGGSLTKSGGLFKVWAPHNDLVPVATITEDDLIADMDAGYSAAGQNDLPYNTATGQYAEPDLLYQFETYPDVVEEGAKTEDGQERLLQFDTVYMQDADRSQRVGRQQIRRSRFTEEWSLPLPISYIWVDVLDVVRINLQSTNHQDMLVRVMSKSISFAQAIIVLTVRVEDPSIYDLSMPLAARPQRTAPSTADGGDLERILAGKNLPNFDFEKGDVGWLYGEGYSIEAAPEFTINGKYAAIHNPAETTHQGLGMPEAAGGGAGAAVDGDAELINKSLIAITDEEKLYFHGRAIGAAGADGKAFLRALFYDGGNALLGSYDTPPVDVIEGRFDMAGPIKDVPLGTTHARFVFVRQGGSKGKLGFDIARYWQNLTEERLNALDLTNGPIDAFAQVNKPIYGLKENVTHDGTAAADRVAVVGFVVGAGGALEITHDNVRTFIPFGNVVRQPRPDELETANLSHMPDGQYYIGYDRQQGGYFSHNGPGLAALDMAAIHITGDKAHWWRVGNGNGGWIEFSDTRVWIIGSVTKQGGALVDADYYNGGVPLDRIGEPSATRLNFTGPYDAGREYRFGDVVSYRDGSYKYISVTASTGNVPTDATYWALLANGTTLLSGDDLPEDDLGVVGDRYLHTPTGDLYTKVDATTWEKTTNIAGGFLDIIFKDAAIRPITPTGAEPSGWFDAPPVASGVPVWISRAYKNSYGELVGEWSIPQQNGGPAIEIQYSQNESNWHSAFLNSDLFMRQRFAGGTWSDSMRIVGEKGQDGGYKDFRYRRSSSQPSTPSGTNPGGWSDGIPSENGDPAWESWVWRRYDGTLNGSWSTPIKISSTIFERRYSENGSSGWHEEPTEDDRYFQERPAGSGSWSDSVPMKGEGALTDLDDVGTGEIRSGAASASGWGVWNGSVNLDGSYDGLGSLYVSGYSNSTDKIVVEGVATVEVGGDYVGMNAQVKNGNGDTKNAGYRKSNGLAGSGSSKRFIDIPFTTVFSGGSGPYSFEMQEDDASSNGSARMTQVRITATVMKR